MLRGRPIVVHGDGCVPWTVTHSEDFAVGLVGLLGNPAAIGPELPHHRGRGVDLGPDSPAVAAAAGAPEPTIVHMASEDIAALLPQRAASLLGDKSHAMVFDNARIKARFPTSGSASPSPRGSAAPSPGSAPIPPQVVTPEGDAEIERLLAAHAALRGG